MTSALARGRRTLVAASIFLFPSLLFAADSVSQPSPVAPVASALQTLLGLGVVLMAIAGTAWLLKRLTPGQVGAAADLRVVAAVAVGPKERVVLVDVGESRLVLGVAPGQVTRLMEMPRPDDDASSSASAAASPFVEKLRTLLAKPGAEK